MAGGAFGGGTFDFLSWFAVVCGLGVMAGYALLGATWLIVKTDGLGAKFGRSAARIALPATLAFVALVSIWTPIAFPHIGRRWFEWPNIAYLSPVPIVTALVAFGIWRHIERHSERRPFLLSIALFLLAFLGLGISLWPYAIPYQATVWQAAASPPTLLFVGIGAAIVLPIVLGYMAFAFRVFRGKTGTDTGYGH
jgi:cytochrome d ubiquinol oxidase subunit II